MTDHRSENPEICLIFPCYNEEEVLPDLLRTLKTLDLGIPIRFLFIDDGSKDRTASLLKEACAADARMACLSFSRNFGHQIAVSAGLKHARGESLQSWMPISRILQNYWNHSLQNGAMAMMWSMVCGRIARNPGFSGFAIVASIAYWIGYQISTFLGMRVILH